MSDNKTEIAAKDLRLGNWVSFRNKHVQITSILEEDIGFGVSGLLNPIGLFTPIPLDASILEKAGFVLNYDGLSESRWDADNLGHGEFGMILHKDGAKTVRYYSERSIPCEYLHQLMNLFFALTGCDLTINI